MNIHVQLNYTFKVVCSKEKNLKEGGRTYYSYLTTKEEKDRSI
jgi:hypothetical protein